jgi:hypothetical protein
MCYAVRFAHRVAADNVLCASQLRRGSAAADVLVDSGGIEDEESERV